MAKSFSWKRKLKPENLSQKKLKAFSEEELQEEEDPFEHDWGLLKPRISTAIEDAVTKSKRLAREGVILAEKERFWEAILRWNAALELTPNNETIHEMKAQSLLELHEVFPAIQAAEKAVSLNPLWSVAYQTLGRAQLAMGEIELAIRVFSKAVHLTPDDKEMWEEDLLWAKQLKEQKFLLDQETKTKSAEEDGHG